MEPGTSYGKRHSTAKESPAKKRKLFDARRNTIQNVNQPNEKPSALSYLGTYNASISAIKQTLHGTVDQIIILMLFVRRAVKRNYDFRLATEMDIAEKFDDAVFAYAFI